MIIEIFIRDQMSLQKQRALSRSIVIDPVQDKIQLKRYYQHQDVLSKIAHTNSIDNLAHKKDYYLLQISKYKKSISQVKMKLNSNQLENQSLLKHMVAIDRRKYSWNQKQKKLPKIKSKQRKQGQLKKQNVKLVQRIMRQRVARSRQELLQQDNNHQNCLQNLRKIKSKQPTSKASLPIFR